MKFSALAKKEFRPNCFDGLRRMEETFPGEKPETLMPSGFQRSCFSRPR
jgi:hypothetical protein